MNSYHIRYMKPEERAFCQELCFSEVKSRTICKVAGEQYLLWLFPMSISLFVMGTMYESISIKIYIVNVCIYLIVAGLGTVLRYFKERKIVLAMQGQSDPIREEFEKGRVESCKLHINYAYMLEEKEDEGPAFVLGVDAENIIFLSEHGYSRGDSQVPGDHVEVVRLPESKKVIAKYWSGTPIPIRKVINSQHVDNNWIEGEIIKKPSYQNW